MMMTIEELKEYCDNLGREIETVKNVIKKKEYAVTKYLKKYVAKKLGLELENVLSVVLPTNQNYYCFHISFENESRDWRIKFRDDWADVAIFKFKTGERIIKTKELKKIYPHIYAKLEFIIKPDLRTAFINTINRLKHICETTNYLDYLQLAYTFLLCNKKTKCFCHDIQKLITQKILT
jgi:hypothetical protein